MKSKLYQTAKFEREADVKMKKQQKHKKIWMMNFNKGTWVKAGVQSGSAADERPKAFGPPLRCSQTGGSFDGETLSIFFTFRPLCCKLIGALHSIPSYRKNRILKIIHLSLGHR